MSPLDAVVSMPGVSIFIVVFVESFRCKVKEPSRGLKWAEEGGEVDGGKVEKVNRGGPILSTHKTDHWFPTPQTSSPGLVPHDTHPIANRNISLNDASSRSVPPSGSSW